MNLTPGLVTSVIALAAIVSPMLVAIINNSHQAKLKTLEFKHDSRVRQFEIYYADKKLRFRNSSAPPESSPATDPIHLHMRICCLRSTELFSFAIIKTRLFCMIFLIL